MKVPEEPYIPIVNRGGQDYSTAPQALRDGPLSAAKRELEQGEKPPFVDAPQAKKMKRPVINAVIKHTKILKPSAAQAMIVRRYEFLQKTVGPQLWINWEVLPTKRELAEHARVYVDIAIRNKKASLKPKEGPYWPEKKHTVRVDDWGTHLKNMKHWD